MRPGAPRFNYFWAWFVVGSADVLLLENVYFSVSNVLRSLPLVRPSVLMALGLVVYVVDSALVPSLERVSSECGDGMRCRSRRFWGAVGYVVVQILWLIVNGVWRHAGAHPAP